MRPGLLADRGAIQHTMTVERVGLGTRLLLNIHEPQEDNHPNSCRAVAAHQNSSSGKALGLDPVRVPLSNVLSYTYYKAIPVNIHKTRRHTPEHYGS
jgi:hypothetical protein